MPHTTPLTVRRALVVLSMGALGCGSDLVLPASPGEAVQNVALTKVDGDEQTGPVGGTLNPLVVRVVDQEQRPVIGLEVAFEISNPAAGMVSPTTATTNSAGEAVAHWTLGTVPGPYTVLARLVAAEGDDKIAEFRAAAEPAEPDTLSPAVPLAQPGHREQPVATPPAVRVVDRFGNPVPNIPVAWQVIAGEGRVTAAFSSTDAQGVATIEWILGSRIGVHKLTAAIESATQPAITFTAHVFLF